MRKPNVRVLLVTVVVAMAGGIASAQQTTVLPFDEALSIYVGHSGTWMNYNAGEEQVAEIEDVVAAFQAGEQVSDDPWIWGDHQINLPQAPEGWDFYEPSEEEPMALHVIVRDTQNRLGEVAITDRLTGATVGVLTADAAGTEIDDSISVAPLTEAFDLQVTQKDAGGVLFRAGANQRKVKEVVVVALPYGWQPNRGVEHDFCSADLGPPWGDPNSPEGKVAIPQSTNLDACAGPKEFINDQAAPTDVSPTYNLLDKKVVRDTTNPLALTLPKTAADQVIAATTLARAPYQHGTNAVPDFTAPPFSWGTVHWHVTPIGEITAVVLVPYYGITTKKWEIQTEISGKIGAARHEGVGSPNPSWEVAGAVTITDEEKKTWQCGDPVAVGDIFGLRIIKNADAFANPIRAITTPVTFQLHVDKAPPDGAPGLVEGTGLAEIDEAWTTPPPPHPMFGDVALLFPAESEGVDEGICTVPLAKGWKWKANGRPRMAPYSQGQVDPFQVPSATARTINCELQMLMTLKVKTVADGQPAEAQVELFRKGEGETWGYVGGGQTMEENGEQVWTTGPLEAGVYKVEARAMMGMGDPTVHEFTVFVDVLQTETVTVEVGGPPGMP